MDALIKKIKAMFKVSSKDGDGNTKNTFGTVNGDDILGSGNTKSSCIFSDNSTNTHSTKTSEHEEDIKNITLVGNAIIAGSCNGDALLKNTGLSEHILKKALSTLEEENIIVSNTGGSSSLPWDIEIIGDLKGYIKSLKEEEVYTFS